MCTRADLVFLFFFNDTATTEIYTLSLHDALPISSGTPPAPRPPHGAFGFRWTAPPEAESSDRKSTRLNSSHDQISYAVFCLKQRIQTPADSHTPLLFDCPSASSATVSTALMRVRR